MKTLEELYRNSGPDLSRLGLRVGLEVHRQLSGTKLFCRCPSDLSDLPSIDVRRRLNVTRSELGEEDDAALWEVGKGRTHTYQFQSSQCLVELDEEPPHIPSQEHLAAALTVVIMLDAIPPKDIMFMRKLVADGSDTTGFQRTALVGLDGRMEVNGKELPIASVCLEEDAARKVAETPDGPVYRLDRLGTPELEITTEPTLDDPELAGAAARAIGDMLRSTGLFKRGIGTIRQDVNVSIDGGARTEIKLVQELNMVSKTIATEAVRQLLLIEVASVLKERGATASSVPEAAIDVTDLFEGTASKVVKNGLKDGGRVKALALRGFGGLMGERTVMFELLGRPLGNIRKGIDDVRRLGPEMAQHVRVRTGLRGLFHSDELPDYGVSPAEVASVRTRLCLNSPFDGFVLVCARSDAADEALGIVRRRALMAIEGVPAEVRRPLPDGRSEFMRPMPGPARMYPETDVPPLPVTEALLSKARSKVPEGTSDRMRRLGSMLDLSDGTIKALCDLELLDMLEDLSSNADPKLVSLLLLKGFPKAREGGLDPSSLSSSSFVDMISGVTDGRYSKEALPEVLIRTLTSVSKGSPEAQALNEAMESFTLGSDVRLLKDAARKVALEGRDLVLRKGEGALGPLMGPLMKEMRGRFDGALISATLREEIRKLMEEGP